MFGWRRRALEAEEKATRAAIGGAILERWWRQDEAKAAGRAATIRRLLEEVELLEQTLGDMSVSYLSEQRRADKAEAERDDERANRRHWEQTAGEINEELARVRAERDAALAALATVGERFGEVMRLLEEQTGGVT